MRTPETPYQTTIVFGPLTPLRAPRAGWLQLIVGYWRRTREMIREITGEGT